MSDLDSAPDLRAAELIDGAGALLVCAGAGMGVDSGLPVMFGDFEWLDRRSQAQLDELTAWRRAHRDIVVVELGAGQAVPTVRRYSELASAATGALVRINPREPQIRHNRGVSLAAGALDTLKALDALLT